MPDLVRPLIEQARKIAENRAKAYADSLADTTPPAVPTGLAASSFVEVGADGTIRPRLSASWDANTDSDLAGYFLSVQKGSSDPVEHAAGLATAWEASAKEGAPYTLMIRAVDASGNTSAWSDPVTVTPSGDVTPPGSVTPDATKPIIQKAGRLVLKGAVPPDSDFDHIEVYRNSISNSGTAALIGTKKGFPFSDDDVAIGDTWFYWAKAVDRSGNKSAFASFGSKLVIDVNDTTAPAVPSGLAISTELTTDDSGTMVVNLPISCDANSEADLDHYEFAVKKGSNSFDVHARADPYMELKGALVGVTYQAKARAVDHSGNKSAYSNIVSLTVGGDTTAPGVVTSVSAVAHPKGVVLKATAPADKDFAGVQVYRHTSNTPASATSIDFVPGRRSKRISYRDDDDTAMTVGTAYWWFMASVDTSGNESSTRTLVGTATFAGVKAADLEDGAVDLGGSKAAGQLPPSRSGVTSGERKVLDPFFRDAANYWLASSGAPVFVAGTADTAAMGVPAAVSFPAANASTRFQIVRANKQATDQLIELDPSTTYKGQFISRVLAGFNGQNRVQVNFLKADLTACSPANGAVSDISYVSSPAASTSTATVKGSITTPSDCAFGLIMPLCDWNTNIAGLAAGGSFISGVQFTPKKSGEDINTGAVDWTTHVAGAGKPADNATVGAQAGVNLKDSGGASLGDADVDNSKARARGFNRNDTFQDWTGSLPASYAASGAPVVAKITSAPRYGRWMMQVSGTASPGADQYISANSISGSELRTPSDLDYVTIEYDIDTDTDFKRAGVIYRVVYQSSSDYKEFRLSLFDEHPSPVANRFYDEAKTIAATVVGAPTGQPTSTVLYLASNHASLSGGAYSAKAPQFARVLVRKATKEEVKTAKALTSTAALVNAAAITLSSGNQAPVGVQMMSFLCADGDVVTYDDLGQTPFYLIDGNGLPSPAAGDTYSLKLNPLSSTGFTCQFKEVTPGVLVDKSASGTNVVETSRPISNAFFAYSLAKGDAADATNDKFKMTVRLAQGSGVVKGHFAVFGVFYDNGSGWQFVADYTYVAASNGAISAIDVTWLLLITASLSATAKFAVQFRSGNADIQPVSTNPIRLITWKNRTDTILNPAPGQLGVVIIPQNAG